MSEPFAAVEEMIRGFAEKIDPAVSLRQRVLTASLVARDRQVRRLRVRRTSCWFMIVLCTIYAGAQVQRSYFQTPGDPRGGELAAATDRAARDMQGLQNCDRSAIVSGTEVASPALNDRIEWEAAESHWKRRDRQSTLISHYF